MIDLIKIIFVLCVIILLLKRKINLGVVMLISSVLLALLYLLPPVKFFYAVVSALRDKTTLLLIAALTLIRIFENVMRKRGIMQRMMDSFGDLVRDRRIIMASMPALIGLLPSMGGALFSAPMVEEASKGLNVPPEKKAFINYLFRHPWEFILPLYPGLVLASALTGFQIRDLIVVNAPYAIALIAGGIIWGLWGIPVVRKKRAEISFDQILSFIPLTLVLIMVMVFHLDLSLSLGIVILLLFVYKRYTPKEIFKAIYEGFSKDIIMIIIGVMTFKSVLNFSGAVDNISMFFSESGIPILPVLFILPFLSGLLTGLTIGFVGSTFPILIALKDAGSLHAISFAFAAGYAGVFLSPVHLCLLLTVDYFKTNMSVVYGRIYKTCILIIAVAVVEYFIL